MDTSVEHTPLVGRGQQIALVDELLHALRTDADGDDPHARALIISGDAGIGKTTLVDAVAERSRAGDLPYGVGHCLDLATGTPFGPVVEALRDLHDHLGSDSDPAPQTSWSASDPRSVPPSLASLLEDTETVGHRKPVVLVIEDLHWADSSVRDFALAALRTCRAPLLLVLTIRADDVTGAHPLRGALVELARSPRAVRVDLQGLG